MAKMSETSRKRWDPIDRKMDNLVNLVNLSEVSQPGLSTDLIAAEAFSS
jgi:hypothetical protein